MALHDILAFSWNDIFPTRPQTGADTELVNETFTFNGGGDVVTYEDRDGDRNELGDNNTGLNDRITGTIDGVSVDELINPEYSYEIFDSNGNSVGEMFALTKGTNALSSIEAFVFDFRPIPGETYTVGSHDGTPPSTPYSQLICFAGGTSIATEKGLVAVEDIRPGLRLLTRDGGLQPVLWTGERKLSFVDILLNPKIRPVLIGAGALGDEQPAQPLIVSPQHRVLVRSKIAQRMFGTHEILVPAVKLVGLAGVDSIMPDNGVTYYHLLCASHEIISANSHWTESLYVGEQTEITIGADALAQIVSDHPEVAQMHLHPLAKVGEDNRGRLNRFVVRENSKRLRHVTVKMQDRDEQKVYLTG